MEIIAMSFNLGVIDWNAISAISTLLAVIVALFHQSFVNRRKVQVSTGLWTECGIHLIRVSVTNRGEKPIWITACGILYQDQEKRVFRLLGDSEFPKKMEPSEVVLCPEPILNNLPIHDIYAKDSLGKFWYLTRKEKKKLADHIEICLDNNPAPKAFGAPSYVERPKAKKK